MSFYLDYWLNLLVYCVIPFGTVAILFVVRRKLLWAAPAISTALAGVTYILVFSLTSPILKIFTNGEWRGFFLLAMLIQLAVVAALTAAAGLLAYLLKRKR